MVALWRKFGSSCGVWCVGDVVLRVEVPGGLPVAAGVVSPVVCFGVAGVDVVGGYGVVGEVGECEGGAGWLVGVLLAGAGGVLG